MRTARPRSARSGAVLPSEKRKRLGSREGTVVTSLALPRALHQGAMVAAVRRNWVFAEVVRDAIAEWLERHDTEARTGKGGR